LNKKKIYLGIVILVVSVFHINALDLDRFSFSFLPAIPTDDGTFSDFGIGFHYTDRFASEIRLNIDEKRTNEKFSGVENSLNAIVRSDWKWLFIPLKYSIIKKDSTHLSTGLGINHYRQDLEENGYFQINSLETPVNAYINNFSMNFTGLFVETEFSHEFHDFFQITAKVELVPYAYLNAKQTVDIIPLFESTFSNAFSHSQSNSDTFSIGGKITLSIFNIIDISAAYNVRNHTFNVIDFDTDFNVFVSSKESSSRSFQIEGLLNLEINESFRANIGIGGIFSSVYLDSTLATEGKRIYFVFGGKKSYL